MADIIITAAVIALPTMMIFYAIGARTYRMYAQHRIQKQFNDLMTQVVMKERAEAISKKEQIDELLAKPFDEMLKTYGSDPKSQRCAKSANIKSRNGSAATYLAASRQQRPHPSRIETFATARVARPSLST